MNKLNLNTNTAAANTTAQGNSKSNLMSNRGNNKELQIKTIGLSGENSMNNTLNNISPIGNQSANQSMEQFMDPSAVSIKKMTKSVQFKINQEDEFNEEQKMEDEFYGEPKVQMINDVTTAKPARSQNFLSGFAQESNFNNIHDETLENNEVGTDSEIRAINTMIGDFLLILNVKAGEKIKKMDLIGDSDPLVEIHFGSRPPLRTEHISNNQNPIWNQKFSFLLKSSVQDPLNINEVLQFYVYDQNTLLKNELIGYCDITLEKLIASKGIDIRLKIRKSAAIADLKKDLNLGFLKINQKFKPLLKSDEAFPESEFIKSINTLELAKIKKRSQSGVLKITTHHIEDLENNNDYDIAIYLKDSLENQTSFARNSSILQSPNLTPPSNKSAKGQAEPKSPILGGKKPSQEFRFTRKKNGSNQIQADWHQKINDFLNASIVIKIQKKNLMSGYKDVADITCNFKQAFDLLKGEPQCVIVELNRTGNDSNLSQNSKNPKGSIASNTSSSPNPKIFITIAYFNSFFTQFPKGKLKLTIKSPQTKQKDTKEESYKINRMRQLKEFEITDALEDCKVQVLETKFAKDSQIAVYVIRPYEFFSNSDQIVFREIFQTFIFIDNKKSQEISLSIAASFYPAGFTDDELVNEYGQQKHVEQFTPSIQPDIGELFQRNSSHYASGSGQEDSLDIQEKLKFQHSSIHSNVDRDLFSLTLSTPKLIVGTDSKKGVVVMRIKDIQDFRWDEINHTPPGRGVGAKDPMFYIIIKTSKNCIKTKNVTEGIDPLWNEVVQIKIHDLNEDIVFKLYKDEAIPTLIAEGKILPSNEYKEFQSWTKQSLCVMLELKSNKSVKIQLNYDMQYRYSKFTRAPKGNLEVNLNQGYGLKYNENSYERPIIRFRLGMQNFQIMEDINPHNARWKSKFMNFETGSVWDVIEIRFYGIKQNTDDLILIGAYTKPLNSIYYDDEMLNQIEIDMAEASSDLGGFLRVQFHYYPHRQGYEADLMEQQVLSHSKLKPLADEQLSVNDKRQGVCYLNLKSIEIKGFESNQTYVVENVRCDISYQKQRCLSKVTTDLRKTQNKEIMNDSFRLVIDDVSMKRYDTQKISVKAIDIDYRGDRKNSEIQLYIGESVIDPYILRQHQGIEIHYQCAIEISEAHFMQKVSKTVKNSTDMDSFKEDQEDEKIYLALMEHKSKAQQLDRENKKELLLNFSIVYISTAFTKNPFGMIIINDLFLLNLTNYLDSNTIRNSSEIFLVFKLNGNKNNTQTGKFTEKDPLKKEKMCLFHQEYDPVDVMRAGDTYTIDTKGLDSYFKWEKQLVLYTSSPLDQLEVEVVYQKLNPAGGNKPIPGSKIVLANILVSIADMSYFLERNAGKDISVANLMDFQGSPDFNPYSQLVIKKATSRNDTVEAINQLKLQNFLNTKDLSYSAYQNQLILIFEAKFLADPVIEREQTKTLLNIDHLFILPRQESYDNYINQGYDAFVKKFEQQKAGGGGAGTPGGSMKASGVSIPRSSLLSQKQQQPSENNHMLVEFHLINLNSILKEVQKLNNKIFCFVAFEYLSKADSISSYVKNSYNYFKEQQKEFTLENTRKLTSTKDEFQEQQKEKQAAAKIKPIINPADQGFTHIVEEMFAPAQELLSLNTQITHIFGVNDFEIHTINEMLEGWVPISTNKIMLSLVVEQNDHKKLSQFRDSLLHNTLSRSTTLLGIQLTGRNSEYGNVEVYQAPIDFDLNSSNFGSNVANANPMNHNKEQVEPSILKTFYQSANLAELVIQKGNNLLMNPMTRAECQVKTRLQTSKFIDTPSGFLSVGLRKMIHNNANFPENSYVKLTLKSKIKMNSLQVDAKLKTPDFKNSEMMSHYKKATKKLGKTEITLNEISNFVIRHFSDLLIISIYHTKNETQTEPIDGDLLHFQTKVELNNLDLNEDKLSILVVGTNSMRSRGPPNYYTFELDLHFKSRLINSKLQTELEIAYENFKLLKGAEFLTKAEEEDYSIEKMLLFIEKHDKNKLSIH